MALTFSPRFLVLILLSFVVVETCESSNVLGKTHVRIANNLDPTTDLVVHCKSRNDDLGAQTLQSAQSFEFTFKPNFWGSTLFFCGFQWGPTEAHWFDIYTQKKPRSEDCKLCFWSILASGPCRFDPNTGSFSICFPWNQGELPF